MLQRLAVTNPKNDKMDPHGVNPTLSIFLPTPFPVAMQGLGATAPWEKDLRIPCLEIIVFTNWKTGIGLSKECYQKWYVRLSCLEFIVLTKWKTGIGLSKSVLSKKKHKILEDYSSYIKIKIRMLNGLSIGRFQSWQKVRKFKIVNRINGSKYQLSYIKKNYLYSDFVQSLTCRSCKSSVISYNQDFRDLRSYPSTTIISNYH